MGIKRLTKFVESNFRGWKDISLENTPIVIDGNGLQYFLSERADLAWRFGGQYSALREIMESFFDALTRKNVAPIYVVYDGVHPVDKHDTLRARNEDLLKRIVNGTTMGNGHKNESIFPPLVVETFRKFLEDYQSTHDNLRVYPGDGEADTLGVTIANKYNCPLLGEDSDYFISSLNKGYIPYSKLMWDDPKLPVTGKVYFRDFFAGSLGIDPDLLIALPALVGNDSISNLVDKTYLKQRIRSNPNNSDEDIEEVIKYIQRQRTMAKLESDLLKYDGNYVLDSFQENLQKAREIYESKQSFDEREFRMTCSYRTRSGDQYPAWIIEQYRNFKLLSSFFVIQRNGIYSQRVIPDDYHQESARIFSRSIRQEVYGIMEVEENVQEVVREEQKIVIQEACPIKSDLSIFKMQEVPKEVRIHKLCTVLKCSPGTLSSLDQQWYVPIASVCYWARTAGIAKNDYKLKALLLCFAECFNRSQDTFEPQFDVRNLHILTQWQSVYRDAVMLNQILALPLPYLSPAFLFDGKVSSYYYQQGDQYLDRRLGKVRMEIRSLYEKLLEAVEGNI